MARDRRSYFLLPNYSYQPPCPNDMATTARRAMTATTNASMARSATLRAGSVIRCLVLLNMPFPFCSRFRQGPKVERDVTPSGPCRFPHNRSQARGPCPAQLSMIIISLNPRPGVEGWNGSMLQLGNGPARYVRLSGDCNVSTLNLYLRVTVDHAPSGGVLFHMKPTPERDTP